MKRTQLIVSWAVAATGAVAVAAVMDQGVTGIFGNRAVLADAAGINPPVTRYVCPGPAVRPVERGTINFDMPPATASVDLHKAANPSFPWVQYDLKTGMRYSYGFSIADYDCDGKPDITMFDSYTPPRRLLEPAAGAIGYIHFNGEAVPRRISTADAYPEIKDRISAVVLFERHLPLDVNSDGLLDIVGVVNSHAAVVAYINPGRRSLLWTRRYISVATPAPINIAAGDIDGDGLADLVVSMRDQPSTDSNPAIRGIVWLKNPGSTGNWVQTAVAGSEGLFDPRTLGVADIDGDGRKDIVSSDNSGSDLSWWRNTPGAWERQIIPGVLPVHGHFGEVRDLDGDGRPDILQPVYQGVAMVRNVDGGKTWQVIRVATFAAEERQLVVANAESGDVDGDGRMDVLVAVSVNNGLPNARGRGGLYLLQQTGAGWEPFKIYEEDSSTVGGSFVDFDANGNPDIVLNSEYQRNGVSLFLSNR